MFLYLKLSFIYFLRFHKEGNHEKKKAAYYYTNIDCLSRNHIGVFISIKKHYQNQLAYELSICASIEYSRGFEQISKDLYNQLYDSAYDSGHEMGYYEGLKAGKMQDTNYSIGYSEGFDIGYDRGNENGYENGYEDWDNENFKTAYEKGYAQGRIYGESYSSIKISQILDSLGDFFENGFAFIAILLICIIMLYLITSCLIDYLKNKFKK